MSQKREVIGPSAVVLAPITFVVTFLFDVSLMSVNIYAMIAVFRQLSERVRKRNGMKLVADWYGRFVMAMSSLRSPLLLVIRLYFGWQLVQTGWGKMHSIPKITDFFMSLGIPLPGLNAHFIAGLEFFGGILLILGLASRLIGLLMTANMLVAYWTADREAFVAVFSDPDKFTAAAPFTILFVSVLILVFGAGFLSLDHLFAKRFHKEQYV